MIEFDSEDDVLLDELHLHINETPEEMRRRNLRQIMERYSLKPNHVASLLGVARRTVWIWTSNSNERDIPKKKLDFLKYAVRNLVKQETSHA